MINESKVLELIKRQKETGLNIRAFCANEGIPKSSYYYWRKKLNNQPAKRFLPLLVKNTAPAAVTNFPKSLTMEQPDQHRSGGDYQMEITYPNGTTLRIKHALDLAGLRSLVLLAD